VTTGATIVVMDVVTGVVIGGVTGANATVVVTGGTVVVTGATLVVTGATLVVTGATVVVSGGTVVVTGVVIGGVSDDAVGIVSCVVTVPADAILGGPAAVALGAVARGAAAAFAVTARVLPAGVTLGVVGARAAGCVAATAGVRGSGGGPVATNGCAAVPTGRARLSARISTASRSAADRGGTTWACGPVGTTRRIQTPGVAVTSTSGSDAASSTPVRAAASDQPAVSVPAGSATRVVAPARAMVQSHIA
jgi:hypothetical protein